MDRALSHLERDRIEPLETHEFARLLDAFAPFEPQPHLAVAVSGGSDSMALALLAAAWTRARGGRLTALTVDHGLRPEAAAEARQVASWCATHGIGHEILRWRDRAPQGGIQAAARGARYRLLEEWCRAHEILHLLVAHQREDQAETLLMRLTQASGAEGLGAISAEVEHRSVRVLRPLLAVPRARLQATLEARAQAWIEDPSNRNPAYLRARLRAQLPGFAERGFTAERLAGLAAQFGRARAVLEVERAELLARSVMLHPAGFAWLDGAVLHAAPPELGITALAAIITAVSGADYTPRGERLERLFGLLPQGLAGGRTLGGCLILPRRGRILICREPAAMAPPIVVLPGAGVRWDGRIGCDLVAPAAAEHRLGGLGGDLAAIRDQIAAPVLATVPPAARATLPVLRDDKGVIAIPALRYRAERAETIGLAIKLLFQPTRPMTGAGFRIV
jgi:tRNA(Ile)-lysidine synthase